MSGNGQEMRDFDAWSRSIKNFEWLADAVPGATDLDVFIERRGQFLVLETKNYSVGSGVRVPFGQYLALLALSKLETFTVYLVGETDDEDVLYVLNLADREPTKIRTAPVWFKSRQFTRTTKEGLAAMCKGWFDESSSRWN